jgi:DNA-binding Lrp family transcriptional regulator
MPEAVTPDRHPIDTMLAVSDLIRHRRLAQTYARVLNQDTPSVGEIASGLDSSTTTVYEDVRRLTDLGLLKRVTDTQPHRYRALQPTVTVQTGETTYEVTPALLVALAQAETNDTIGVYLDRHGVAGLATALDYARAYARGRMTARIMAREQDVTVLEAETILQELRDVIRDVDPSATEELDLDELDAAVDELEQE